MAARDEYASTLKCVYCTRDISFDKTFMLARVHNQRIFGYYYCTPRTHISQLVHSYSICVLDAQEETSHQSPVNINNVLASDQEIEADTSAHLPPNGRNRHNKANQFLDPQDM